MKILQLPTLIRLTALILLSGIATLSRAQSSADNPLYRHIPADAEKVYEVSYTSLTSKIDIKGLLAQIPQKPGGKNMEYAAFFADPTLAGIDTRQGIFITETNTLNPDSPRYTTLLLPLTDSGKFIRFLKEQDKTADFIILPGKTRTAREGTKIGCAWNDKLAVITFVKAPIRPDSLQMQMPSGHTKPHTVSPPSTDHHYALLGIRKSAAALKGFNNSPFSTDAFFRDGFADDADLHTWSRFNSGIGMASTVMQMAHAPMDASFLETAKKLKNSHTHTLGTLRFDNGRITFRSKVRYDSIGNLEFTPRPLNTGLIEHLPQGNLLGIATLHFDPSNYFGILEKFQNGKSLHTLDSVLAKKGLTTKDFLTAFKGDLLVAVIASDKPAPAATDTTPAHPAKPNVYVVLTINDRAAFTKITNTLHLIKDSADHAVPDTSSKPSPLSKWHPAHTLRDDVFVLGPNQQATDGYFDQPGRGPSRLVTAEVRSSPFALAIDIKAIAAYLQPVLSASAKDKQLLTLLNLFDQITFTTARMQGKEMESLVEIKMTDQQQNSLSTLMQIVRSMH
jgi:hypothetical protein